MSLNSSGIIDFVFRSSDDKLKGIRVVCYDIIFAITLVANVWNYLIKAKTFLVIPLEWLLPVASAEEVYSCWTV